MNELELFTDALSRTDPADRAAFLDRACAGQPDLRRRMDALLAGYAQGSNPLDRVQPEHTATGSPAAGKPVATGDFPGADESAGTIIGEKYKLLEKIGEGGMGSVYMAQQTEPVKRVVAVKVIKAGMDSKAVLARFEAERQALAMMDHPNIARVLDAGTTRSGRPFFVMELVTGTPITQFCDERKLTPRQRLELYVPVCHAIQHAHQKGIIHRDIKPSNVQVAMYDDRAVPKVIDFGVAKAAGQLLTDKTLFTAFGAVIGTPEYMSPEQAHLNNLDIDTRSDVYSLGVLLYELLTGATPVDRKSLGKAAVLEILRIVREVEAPRPSARISSLDTPPSVAACRGTEPAKLSKLMRGELDWVLMKALEKDRTRRYETANGLARDIQRYLADEVIEARPPSPGYRLRKLVRRNKGRVAVVGVIVLALVGGLIGTAYGLSEAANQRTANSLRERAEQERDAAATARDGQSEARAAAEVARTDAEKARDAEKAVREKLARVEYGRTMNVAYQEWRDNNIRATKDLLKSARPESRGWEWHYLHRLCHPNGLTIKGHSSFLSSAAFHPDGSRIVTASFDKTARVWDARTGLELLHLSGHLAAVSSAAFDPGGTRIVTASFDKTAKVWDARTGKVLLTLSGHSAIVPMASFDASGTRIVTTSFDKTAKVWDAKTGSLLHTLEGHSSEVVSAAFSPDGTRIVTSGGSKTVKLWDAKTGADIRTLKGLTGEVESVAFSPNSSRVVTGGNDRMAKVWDVKSGDELLTFRGHKASIQSVSFRSDGKRILTASSDRTAKIWDAETGSELHTLMGHTDYLGSAAYNADGSRIVTASVDGTAKVWDVPDDAQVVPPAQDSSAYSHSWTDDGTSIATAFSDGTVSVADARTGHVTLRLPARAGLGFASLDRDGSRIITGGDDLAAKVWDAISGAELFILKGHTSAVTAATFSPDGSRIVTASKDETAKVWDAKTGTELLTLRGHKAVIHAASFSGDGKRIVTGSSARFSPDLSMIEPGTDENQAKIWDAQSGEELLTLKGHTSNVMSAKFSPDGSCVITGSRDFTSKVWDAKTGAEILTLRGHTHIVFSAAMHPDGSRIATGCNDGTVKLWDGKSGDEVLTLKGHNSPVRDLSFSPDGSRIYGGSMEGFKVWDSRPVNRKFLPPVATPAVPAKK